MTFWDCAPPSALLDLGHPDPRHRIVRCLLLPEQSQLTHHLQINEELNDDRKVDVVVVVALVVVAYRLLEAIDSGSALAVHKEARYVFAKVVAWPQVEVEIPILLFVH